MVHPQHSTATRPIFVTLDGIRGAASLIVVLWHTPILFGLTSNSKSYLAVDVFFAISGVVIANAYENRLVQGLSASRFAVIRLIRLYPLYILATLCSVVTLAFGADLQLNSRDFASIIVLGIFFIPNPRIGNVVQMFPLDDPAWSLFFELCANFFYGLTARLLSNCALLGVIALSAIGLIVSAQILADHTLNVGFTVRSSPAGFCRTGYSFFVGVLLHRLYTRKQRRSRTSTRLSEVASWTILLLISGLLLSSPPKDVSDRFDLDLVYVLIIFPCLIYAALHVQPERASAKIFGLFGATSYAVYVLHVPMFALVKLIAANYESQIGRLAPWTGCAFLVVLLGLSWILDQVFDLPIRRFLLSRLKKHSLVLRSGRLI